MYQALRMDGVMSPNWHCPSYQGACCLVRETVTNERVTVMHVLFQTEKCVWSGEGSTVLWHGLGKSRKASPRIGAFAESLDGGSSMCGGPVTGGSLEHFRNAEETSVS